MPEKKNQPGDNDAVLGGNSPPPIESVVLGGIEGIKRRLSNPVVSVRVAALTEALSYGDAGLDVVTQGLQDESKQVQRQAYQLLRKRQEPQIQQALQSYKPWILEERCNGNTGYGALHTDTFFCRKIVDYDPQTGITDPKAIAYALRSEYFSSDSEPNVTEKLAKLLEDPLVGELEAIVIGMWNDPYEESSSGIVNALVAAKNRLTNLKAVFIGNMGSEECEISWIVQSDISPILRAYPKLEVLQVRGGERLEFSPPIRHNHLKALIVETGGLGNDVVEAICNFQLPALEHLELWFGSDNYGGNCWIDNVTPIINDIIFPNLNYLGLRNSQFADEIAEAIAKSPILESISVLDLSLGTLSDEGAEKLLNCPAINKLDTLNVSDNFLSDKMVKKLSQLDIRVIAVDQNQEDKDSYLHSRYCSVSE